MPQVLPTTRCRLSAATLRRPSPTRTHCTLATDHISFSPLSFPLYPLHLPSKLHPIRRSVTFCCVCCLRLDRNAILFSLVEPQIINTNSQLTLRSYNAVHSRTLIKGIMLNRVAAGSYCAHSVRQASFPLRPASHLASSQ